MTGKLRRAGLYLTLVLGLVLAALLIAHSLPPIGAELPGAGGGGGDGGEGGDGRRGGGDGGGQGALRPGQGAEARGGALAPGDEFLMPGGYGENRSLAETAEAAFVVEADRPAYWRVRAYGLYDGAAWRRFESRPAVRGGPPRHPEAVELRQRYVAKGHVEPTPAAWRAARLEEGRRHGLAVEDGRVAGERLLRPNQSYAVTSVVPPRNASVLRLGDGVAPPGLAPYRRVPASVPDRVVSLADRITANASTTYGRARAIERWLDDHKNYSSLRPNATDDRLERFLFERDTGDSADYATAAAVMLRTQGVPARFVVGYSTGQRIGNDTYLVREFNEHAWVEIYVADVGWVRFDPAPYATRRIAERRALAMARSSLRDEVDVGKSTGVPYLRSGEGNGSDGLRRELFERPEPGPLGGDGVGSDGRGDAAGESGPSIETEGGYTVRLSREPVPGARVTATVTRDGRPVEDAVVSFNREVVGRTDARGEVAARVPYAPFLEVVVDEHRPPPAATPASHGGGPDGRIGDLRLLSSHGGSGPDGGSGDDPGTTERYPLPTAIDLDVEPPISPGATMTLRAAIDDVPVRDGRVTVNGRYVGDTDRLGEIPLRVPPGVETMAIAVERGGARGSVRLDVTDPIDVTLDGTVAAGHGVTLTATILGDPVAGAAVAVDGERVGTTDRLGRLDVAVPYEDAIRVRVSGDGVTTVERFDVDATIDVHGAGLLLPGQRGGVRATVAGEPVPNASVRTGFAAGLTDRDGRFGFAVPWTNAVTVEVRRGEAAGERRFGWLYLPYGLLAGALLWLLAWLVRRRRRVARGGRRTAATTAGLLERGAERLRLAVLALAERGPAALGRLRDVPPWLVARLRGLWRHLARLAGRRPSRSGATAEVRRCWRWLRRLPRATVGRCLGLLGRRADEGDGDREAAPSGQAGTAGTREPASVEEAWRRLADRVAARSDRVRRRRASRTPGEVARAAEDAGFPGDAVRRLTRVFREVRYGGRGRTEDRLGAARRALADCADGVAGGAAAGDGRDDGDVEREV